MVPTLTISLTHINSNPNDPGYGLNAQVQGCGVVAGKFQGKHAELTITVHNAKLNHNSRLVTSQTDPDLTN